MHDGVLHISVPWMQTSRLSFLSMDMAFKSGEDGMVWIGPGRIGPYKTQLKVDLSWVLLYSCYMRKSDIGSEQTRRMCEREATKCVSRKG